MDKTLGLIGLAKRAGRLVCGESAVKEGVRFGKARLVIIASDASDNTQKNISDSCKYYDVNYYIAYDKDTLGHAVGNSYNAAIAITDEGFAKSIEKNLQSIINGGE